MVFVIFHVSRIMNVPIVFVFGKFLLLVLYVAASLLIKLKPTNPVSSTLVGNNPLARDYVSFLPKPNFFIYSTLVANAH